MIIENRTIKANLKDEYIKRKYTEMETVNLFKMVSLGDNENENNYMSVIVTKEEYQEMVEKELQELEETFL